MSSLIRAQDRLRQDLALVSGAALVNSLHPGVGAVERSVQEELRDTVNVKKFGALDDYESPGFDSAPAFQKAADYCRLYERTLVADGEFNLGATVDLRGVALAMENVDLHLTHSAIGLILGGGASSGFNPPQRVRAVRRNGGMIDTPEIRIIGAKNQDIFVTYANYLQLYATSSGTDFAQTDSIAYSNFHFNRLLKLELASDPSNTLPTPNVQGSRIQWINENNFHLNRCTELVLGTLGTLYKHNHNRFYGGTFEGAASIICNIGRENRMYNMRFEAGPTTIYFGPLTDRTVIHSVYDEADFNTGDPESPIDNGTITDLGNGNAVVDDFRLWQLTETVAYADINDVVLNNEVGPTQTRRPFLQCVQGGGANQSVMESDFLPVRNQDVIKFVTEGAEPGDTVFYRPYIYFFDKNLQVLTPLASWITTINMLTVTANAITTGTGVEQQVLRIQRPALDAGAVFCKVGWRASSGQLPGGLARRLYAKMSTANYVLRSSVEIPQRGRTPKAVTAIPTQGFAPLGYQVAKSDGASVYICSFSLDTVSAAGAASGASDIDVASVAGVTNGTIVGINLADRTTQWTTVSSVAGSTVNLAAPLTAAASAGARVVFNRWATK